jgi:hypothetical protein
MIPSVNWIVATGLWQQDDVLIGSPEKKIPVTVDRKPSSLYNQGGLHLIS